MGPREYLWLDVVLAAMLRGEWRPFERQLAEGLACVAAAGAGVGDDPRVTWPDDLAIEEAANAFRYERDLVASDDTIAWLDRAGVPFDAWTHYLVRRLLHARHRDHLDDILPRRVALTSVADEDVAAEGLCSGIFDRFLRTLAGRAAIAAGRDHVDHAAVDIAFTQPSTQSTRSTQSTQSIDGLRTEHTAWLDALDPGDLTERATHLAHLESAFHAQVEAATTADTLAVQLDRHRFEWMRVDLERIGFESADAAREAACCVREDGLTLSEVAIASRQPVRDTRDVLEHLDPALRHAVLAGDIDTLAGPIAVGSRHEVVWVVGKRPADLADPIVRARAERAIVDHMIARAILTHVRWAGEPRGVRYSPPDPVRQRSATV